MTKYKFLTLTVTCISISFHAQLAGASPPLEGAFMRYGFEATTWQEPLLIQDANGFTDTSVATYRGFNLTVERQWRTLGGGFGFLISAGSGQVAGGGTSKTVVYNQGSTPYTNFAIEPSWIWTFNEMIDFSVAVAGTYRSVNWMSAPIGYQISPVNNSNAVFYFDIDLALSEHLGLRQAIGIAAASPNTFWRWGLTYDY